MIILILISVFIAIILGIILAIKLNQICRGIKKINMGIRDLKISGCLTEFKLILKNFNKKLSSVEECKINSHKNFSLAKIINAVVLGVSIFKFISNHHINIKQYFKKHK